MYTQGTVGLPSYIKLLKYKGGVNILCATHGSPKCCNGQALMTVAPYCYIYDTDIHNDAYCGIPIAFCVHIIIVILIMQREKLYNELCFPNGKKKF